MDVGDIVLGEFTLRVTPVFAPIVNAAGSDYQFAVAGNLDAANIPFFDADALHQGVVQDVLAAGTVEEQPAVLEQVGHSFLGAYGETALDLMRGQNMAVDQRFQDLQSGGFSSGDVELPEGTANSKELAAILSTSSGGLDFGLGGNTGTRGDLYGDLWIILRDSDGVPILSDAGFVQPLDANGELIDLDDEGHPLDESLTQEVELGRLNVGRAPLDVLDLRSEEVVDMLLAATTITTDAAGRLVLTVDGEGKTIDSPLENLAIYVALMTSGTIDSVSDLPGSDFDFLIDGVLTAADLEAFATFLAAATDKTGIFTSDEIAYINTILSINTVTDGGLTYSDVDFSTFVYDRTDTYGDIEVEVLVQQTDGSRVPTLVSILDAVFDGETAADAGSLDAYTLAADDARMVINFIHEYEIPEDDTN